MDLTEPQAIAGPAYGTVQVWQMRCSALQGPRSQWQTWLSPDECQRLTQYHRLRDRDRFLCSRGGLRYLLASYLQQSPTDIQLTYGTQGRPALANPAAALHFNVAHSGDWVIWAFSHSPQVGVDVEVLKPRRRLQALIQKCLTPEERLALSGPPATQLNRFLAMWTVKEAHLKAIGLGLSYPLQKVQVAIEPEPAIVYPAVCSTSAATAWQVKLWQPDNTAIAAVCVGQSPCSFEFFDLATASAESASRPS